MRYFVSFLLIISLCACSADADIADDERLVSVTVIDHAGREVEIKQPVEKLVSGYYISSSVCIALGLTDRFTGIEAGTDTRPIYSLAAPELLELPSVGTARDFNIEACLALDPDLVLLPLRLQAEADILAEMGVPVILLNPETYEGLLHMIEIIGDATGTADKAELLVKRYNEILTQIHTDMPVPATAHQQGVYICGTGSYLTTAPGGMFQSWLVENAGGRNVAQNIEASSRVEVSYEQLLAWDPGVIIIPSEADYGIDDIMQDAQLAELRAVKNGCIYKMPADYEAWDSPIPASVLGIRWLQSVMFEGYFSQEELQKTADEFYEEFYGVRK